MTSQGVTVRELRDLLGSLEPDDLLVRNAVGNVTILRNSNYLGFIDLFFGEVEICESENSEAVHP